MITAIFYVLIHLYNNCALNNMKFKGTFVIQTFFPGYKFEL